MDISLDYYKTFYFVAKCGNLTMAAHQMGASQPNVTRIIKLLEAQLGSTLFVRSKTGMNLTPSGLRLYGQIRPAVERIASAEYDLKADFSLKKGVVSLGVTEIALRCFLLPILGNFHRTYPGIRFRIYNYSSGNAIDALKAGLVDMAIVTSPFPAGDSLVVQVLKSFQEWPICGSMFISLPKRAVSIEDLHKLPLISLVNGSATYSFYVEWFRRHNLPFCPDIEAATADQIIPLVGQNLGIGFVPEEFLKNAGTDIHPLTLLESIPQRDICCVTSKGLPFNPAAKRFHEKILLARKAKKNNN